jgi:uracil-DNA glycosylase family 4
MQNFYAASIGGENNMGFFDADKSRIRIEVSKHHTCAACGLYKKVRNPRMAAFGNFKKRILNIGEAPGETEDERGRQWQGKMGHVLQIAYKKLGIDLFEDCLNINACNCRPLDKDGNNRAPTDKEIGACRSKVMRLIDDHKPCVIIVLGQAALASIIGARWTKDLDTISKWRGWTIPDRGLNAWLCPTFHPSYIERGEQELETIWMQDLEQAFAKVDDPLPEWTDEAKQVEIVDNTDFLGDLKGPVAFDFETTGLKPHDVQHHSVICMSVCNSPDKAYAFMVEGHKEHRRNIRMFLKSDVPKIAQNMKFEHTWSHNILNCEVKNWIWDTMLATHVIDNRYGVTGLKFQAYVQFGVIEYDSGVSEYLKGKDKKNANAVNRIDELIKSEAGRNKLLTYCGMDSLFEYRLAMQQMKLFGKEIPYER